MSQDGTWRWNHLTDTWEKAPAVVTSLRLVGIGQVIAGAHKLYWMHHNPSAGLSVIEITDAIAAAGPVQYDCFHTGREGHHVIFDPPLDFTVGIYLETLTNMTSAIFGFI